MVVAQYLVLGSRHNGGDLLLSGIDDAHSPSSARNSAALFAPTGHIQVPAVSKRSWGRVHGSAQPSTRSREYLRQLLRPGDTPTSAKKLRKRQCRQEEIKEHVAQSAFPLAWSKECSQFIHTHKAWCSETLVWHRLGIASVDAWGLR